MHRPILHNRHRSSASCSNDRQVSRQRIVSFISYLPPPNHRQTNIFPSKRKLRMSSPNAWSSVTPGSDNVYSLTSSIFILPLTSYFLHQTSDIRHLHDLLINQLFDGIDIVNLNLTECRKSVCTNLRDGIGNIATFGIWCYACIFGDGLGAWSNNQNDRLLPSGEYIPLNFSFSFPNLNEPLRTTKPFSQNTSSGVVLTSAF